MKVKLLVSRAGVGFSDSRGAVIDVDDAEGIRMIEAGQAEPVRAARPEKAVPRGRKAERS